MRLRASLLLGAVLFLSYAFFYQGGGWNQYSRLDVARAVVEHGTLRIDRYASNTGDKAFHRGHYYSDKAPGQPVLGVAAVAATRPFLALSRTDIDSQRGVRIMTYT